VNKKRVPQALTALLMAGLLGFFVYKQRGSSPSSPAAVEDAPESAVWRMVDAARAGDPGRYLDCYTGEMEGLLQRNLQEMGVERFRQYLTGAHRQVKGIAVTAPQMTSAGEGRISVEYVYQDRNELQQVFVRRVGKQWKIFRVESAERIKTLVPYGTPVTE